MKNANSIVICAFIVLALIVEGQSNVLVNRFVQRFTHRKVIAAKQDILNADWDHFVFSQQWPMSVCIDSHLTHKHDCEIPANVSTWTVHGIWPSLGKSQGPGFCNKTAKFDPDSIASIVDQLEVFWPNLYADSPLDQFWEHEWDKHGTCAMSLPSLDSELKYFSKGLELSRTFDLLGLLNHQNVIPSSSSAYPYEDFVAALTSGLGQKPSINCIYDKSTKTQYIVEVEFCLDKSFAVIACPAKSSALNQEQPCRDSEQIAYPIITRF